MKGLFIGAIAIGGFLIYKMMSQAKVQQPSTLSPYNTAPNLMGQPQQQYPYQPAPTPRADSSNQPWYQANRAFIQPQASVGDANFLTNVQYVKGAAEVASSISSIWDDLGGMFGTQDDPAPKSSNVASSGGIDWAALGIS